MIGWLVCFAVVMTSLVVGQGEESGWRRGDGDAAGAGSVIYVDDTATPGGDGRSWVSAFRDLQDGLDAAAMDESVAEVRVAAGTYRPDRGTGLRSAAFVMRDGLSVIGGFADGGSDVPDAGTHESVLSGDLLGDDGSGFENRSDNSMRVVIASGVGPGATLEGFTVRGGSGDKIGGGGLFCFGGAPTVRRCRFEGHTSAGDGGHVRITAALPGMTFADCSFEHGEAEGGGGLVAISGSREVVRFERCAFASGYASIRGGGFDVVGSEVDIADCTFNGLASGGIDLDTDTMGGAIYAERSSVTVRRSSFTDCEARSLWIAGDFSEGDGGGIYSVDGSLTVEGSRFTRCSTYEQTRLGRGGGIYCLASELVLRDTDFMQGTASRGGGVETRFGSLEVEGCLFSACVGTALVADPDGGGVIRSTDFTFNTSIGSAGALSGDNVDVIDCTFSVNSALGSGGAAYGGGTYSGCRFIANSAGRRGGGVYEAGELIDCAFVANTADEVGGAVGYVKGDIVGCEFESNDSGLRGGAVWTVNFVRVFDSVFIGNRSAIGGAISLESSLVNAEDRVSSCDFVGNLATQDGGALHGLIRGATEVTNCVIAGNHAEGMGGVGYDMAGLWQFCTVLDNSSGSGSGIVASGDLLTYASIYWGNADVAGGVVTESSHFPVARVEAVACAIEGLDLLAGGGNVDADPDFVDSVGPDGVVGTGDESYQLSVSSPLIDEVPFDIRFLQVPVDRQGLSRRTGFGGGPSLSDMGAYELHDCNMNGVPDGEDIAVGIAGDCDGDLVPDSCGLLSFDCDGNGVRDGCQIAVGDAEDCDLDGVPDACGLAEGYLYDSGRLCDWESGGITAFHIPAVPVDGDVTFELEHITPVAGWGGDFLIVELDGFRVWERERQVDVAAACEPALDVFTAERNQFNFLVGKNAGGVLRLTARYRNSEDFRCPNGYVRMRVSAPSAAASDCDGDGVSDRCQIMLDPDADFNGSGLLDSCECLADVAVPAGVVDVDDLLAFLAAFLAMSDVADVAPPAGSWDIDDVLVFLGSFTMSCQDGAGLHGGEGAWR